MSRYSKVHKYTIEVCLILVKCRLVRKLRIKRSTENILFVIVKVHFSKLSCNHVRDKLWWDRFILEILA